MSIPLYSGNISETLYKLEQQTTPEGVVSNGIKSSSYSSVPSLGIETSNQYSPISENSGINMDLFSTYMKQANLSTYYQQHPNSGIMQTKK